ncbi:probable serine/threonine-protein kinase mps1 [Teleopsis dalmanni]|uniref:probable serine/threonine-protein kinase mps1 n=1 Tax=Teleopsis dalmanni TaxID=139649 RepID=UPI0018CE728A|nr:probable serine/threonine-protein kinase mps1 [Teleopsis dalmanni]
MLVTMATFAFNELREIESADSPSVLRVLINSIRSDKRSEDINNRNMTAPEKAESKILLINLEQQNDTNNLLNTIFNNENLVGTQRKVRDVNNNANLNTKPDTVETATRKTLNTYEEQQPVVVHAESYAPILGYRQPTYGPPRSQETSDEESRYRSAANDEENDDDNTDYRSEIGEREYFEREHENEQSYFDSHENFNESTDSEEDRNRATYERAEESNNDEGRSSHNPEYDSYYRNWYYATPATPKADIETANIGNKRKLQQLQPMDINTQPDPVYDYDYPQSSAAHANMPQYHTKDTRLQQQQLQEKKTGLQQQRRPIQNENSEPTIVTVVKSLKTMWDIYQAFSSAWNTLAEHRQKQQEILEQKQIEHRKQIRINSKKPPKFDSNKNEQSSQKNGTTENPKTTKATKTTKTTKLPTTPSTTVSKADEDTAKVEPRKGSKGDKANKKETEGLREKRQSMSDSTAVADVGEGRYIKGDPLKGYYDYVITEGSYKFWAVFQVGTALLIIYSTFAAIYYSKVNPLVSDYDYTDYLGGGRSLSGGDLDFVDDEDNTKSKASSSWLQWLPRTGHSLKFILDAIDKIPVDHDHATEKSFAGKTE